MDVVELDLASRRASSGTGAPAAWSSVQPRVGPVEDGDGVEREDPPQAVEEDRHRRRAREAGERLGLGAGAGAVGGATRGERDEGADDRSDGEEDREREQVLALARS